MTGPDDPDIPPEAPVVRFPQSRVLPSGSGEPVKELGTSGLAARGYQNRSEAIRDLARAGMREAAEDAGQKRECVAALVYTYDHAARQLSKRLTTAYHEHHELSLASLHVHLDHDTCLEVTVLKGKTEDVQHFGEHVIAERGVRHGKIVRMPVEPAGPTHRVSHRHDG